MFKNIRTKFAVALSLSLFTVATQAAIVELADNGGFETGDFTGWTVLPSGGGTLVVSTLGPASGTYSANLSPPAAPVSEIIRQERKGMGVVMPGQTVTVVFKARGTLSNGGVANAEFFSQDSGGGVTATMLLGGAPLGLNADPDVWTTFSFTPVAANDVSGGITLQLLASCAPIAGCRADVYFDDVSITVQAIPIPAAIWLFGSGLLGLVGIARRKTAA